MKKIYQVLVINFLFSQFLFSQNYSFGPNVKVNDDPGGQAFHAVYSSGMHSIAARGDTVYIAYRGDQTGLSSVYFTKSTDAGLTWSPGRRVSYPNAGIVEALSVDNRGNIFIVYEHADTNNYWDIHFTRSTDGGLNFSYPIKVNDDTSWWTQSYPTITVDTSGQKVFIAWHDARNIGTSEGDLYFSRSTDGGLTFTPNIRIDDTGNNSSDQTLPSIASDRNGDNVYVTWQDERNYSTKYVDIYFAQSTNGGNSFLSNVLVNDTANTGNTVQWSPSIAVDTLRRIYIAWEDHRATNAGCFLSRSDDGGLTFGPNIKITDGGNMNTDPPSIAVDDSNGVYIAWGGDWRVYGYRVFFAYSNNAGDSFFPNVRVDDYSPDSNGWFWYATLAINQAKKVFVAWSDDRLNHTNCFDIYFASGSYVGIEEEHNYHVNSSIKCFPNPFSKSTELFLLTSDIKSICIYDCLGRIIRKYDIGSFYNQSRRSIIWDGCDRSGLSMPVGAYFVIVEKKDASKETVKIIKIK